MQQNTSSFLLRGNLGFESTIHSCFTFCSSASIHLICWSIVSITVHGEMRPNSSPRSYKKLYVELHLIYTLWWQRDTYFCNMEGEQSYMRGRISDDHYTAMLNRLIVEATISSSPLFSWTLKWRSLCCRQRRTVNRNQDFGLWCTFALRKTYLNSIPLI